MGTGDWEVAYWEESPWWGCGSVEWIPGKLPAVGWKLEVEICQGHISNYLVRTLKRILIIDD